MKGDSVGAPPWRTSESWLHSELKWSSTEEVMHRAERGVASACMDVDMLKHADAENISPAICVSHCVEQCT